MGLSKQGQNLVTVKNVGTVEIVDLYNMLFSTMYFSSKSSLLCIASVIDKQITNLVNSQKNYDREKLSIKLSKQLKSLILAQSER